MNLKLQTSSLVAVLSLALIQTSRANDIPSVVLTLQQAQGMAITNHPRITQAELIALAAQQVVREVRSAYFRG